MTVEPESCTHALLGTNTLRLAIHWNVESLVKITGEHTGTGQPFDAEELGRIVGLCGTIERQATTLLTEV